MIEVAIVEDEPAAAEELKSYLARYEKESGTAFAVTVFRNAVTFLAGYKPKYGIVFMDIEMPDLNGMDASRKLREVDSAVVLIFVTNMAQYAVKGYEVDALDFIVKPVAYPNFVMKIKKAVARIAANDERELNVNLVGGGVARLRVSRLRYAEVIGHHVVYHSEDGDFESYGTLKNIEAALDGLPFARCNNCYLVNLKYVYAVRGYVAQVGDEQLRISQPKKKDFMRALNDYIGNGCDVPL